MLLSAYITISHILFLVCGPANEASWLLRRLTSEWTTLGLGSAFALASLVWTGCYTSADDYRDLPELHSKPEGITSKSQQEFNTDAGENRYVARLLVCIAAVFTLEIDLIYFYVDILRLLWLIIMGALDGTLWMDLVCALTFTVSVIGIPCSREQQGGFS